ncbi:esterase-like activity of phytase family protein [Roseomonas sp. PWR1]|uniref:Esterase-like activity of phytase family protein n=1 Tax=Roseomonas nitratireducens TaxID=2820810 RepID=A0ABS4AVD4_9PROT|nr:esterase-like activity of phytase family protein [Neoroseomonas nitratireducens]MBP0465335.1 esterase-like activity of phytase family protein [Neoroseomonas nitratireducens]
MRRFLLATALIAAGPAFADQRFEATLAGHAVLPAFTMAVPPADAPRDALLSGKFAGPGNLRIDRPGAVMGDTGAMHGNRPTGIAFPFVGQAVQGFSGIKPVANEPGAYWVLTDNGFGNRRNSPDSLLMFHKVRPDFATGQVALLQTTFLRDPLRRIPFRIAYEGTEARYLTGADFDLESIQPLPDGSFMIGEEFGPFLIHVAADGVVQRVIETRMDGQVLMSPDHPSLQVAASPTAGVPHRVRRSGGYEGMALTPDAQTLWAMLEQPLFAPNSDQPEGQFLRVLEFNVPRMEWTGRTLRYRLEPGATAIGDFNFIDATRALVIERDNGEGDPGLACAQGARPTAQAPCFPLPARFKRVYLVDFEQVDAEGFVRKIGHIDLMAIRDTEGLARVRGDLPANAPRERFTFPFFTIENVAAVDADHIIVGNDNNLPFSAGRHFFQADANELILLRVPEFLRAR